MAICKYHVARRAAHCSAINLWLKELVSKKGNGYLFVFLRICVYMMVVICEDNMSLNCLYLKFCMVNDKMLVDEKMKERLSESQAKWAGQHLPARKKKGIIPRSRNNTGKQINGFINPLKIDR